MVGSLIDGEMAERLNAAVLKTAGPSRGSWVRIPLSPWYLCRRTQTGLTNVWLQLGQSIEHRGVRFIRLGRGYDDSIVVFREIAQRGIERRCGGVRVAWEFEVRDAFAGSAMCGDLFVHDRGIGEYDPRGRCVVRGERARRAHAAGIAHGDGRAKSACDCGRRDRSRAQNRRRRCRAVDDRRLDADARGPPSTMRSTSSPRSSRTCAAVVGLTRPKRFAEGATRRRRTRAERRGERMIDDA